MINVQKQNEPNLASFMTRIFNKISTPEYIEESKPAYSFGVNKRQAKKISEFITEHNKDCVYADPRSQGAVGGRFTYEFCNTTLGQVCKFKCECGASVDVTDYDEW